MPLELVREPIQVADTRARSHLAGELPRIFQRRSDFCDAHPDADEICENHSRKRSVITGMYVSGGFFGALGIPRAAGRLIGIEDDQEAALQVAVLSYGFAQRRFGSSAQAIGR